MTICFYVNDCKISHISSKVLNETMEWLWAKYERIFVDGSGKMKVNQGKVHKYLGMSIDFRKKGKVKISMYNYVKELVSTWDNIGEMKDVDGFKIILSNKRY